MRHRATSLPKRARSLSSASSLLPTFSDDYSTSWLMDDAMSAQRTDAETTSPLEVLGIGPDEERAYRMLLATGVATAEDFARSMALPLKKAQRLLDAITARGLTTHSPEFPRRYIPASPDIAIEALAHQHQRSVQRARGMIEELRRHAAAARTGAKEQQEQPIELISTPDVGRLVYKQMYESVEHEVLGLVRPPILYSVLSTPPDSSAQQALSARGIRHRSISDAEMVSIPGFPERVRADVEAGEEARLMESVPFKMVLFDRRIGLLAPTHPDQASIVIRNSALLDALHALFENLWERAVPVTFARTGELQKGSAPSRLSKEDEELVWMMSIGMNDKSIAHNLQVSVRTLERRVAELMQGLSARTRFQAGWDAALYLSSTEASSKKPPAHHSPKRMTRKPIARK